MCARASLHPRKTGRPPGDEPWERATVSLPQYLLALARANGKVSAVIEQALRAYLLGE